MAIKVKPLINKLARFVVFACVALLLWVFLLRFIPIAYTGLMLERQVEAWFSAGKVKRQHAWIAFDEMSSHVKQAVVAAEDQKFLAHNGFDFDAIEQALEANQQGKSIRGASTISQQTAKNVFLWSGRSWLRKGLEAGFTGLIELFWGKKRILEVYLNSIEFGTGVFGVEAAAQHYFAKSALKLTRHEAALLAAVLPNPHRLKVDKPSAYVAERQKWILRQMTQLPSVEQALNAPKT